MDFICRSELPNQYSQPSWSMWKRVTGFKILVTSAVNEINRKAVRVGKNQNRFWGRKTNYETLLRSLGETYQGLVLSWHHLYWRKVQKMLKHTKELEFVGQECMWTQFRMDFGLARGWFYSLNKECKNIFRFSRELVSSVWDKWNLTYFRTSNLIIQLSVKYGSRRFWDWRCFGITNLITVEAVAINSVLRGKGYFLHLTLTTSTPRFTFNLVINTSKHFIISILWLPLFLIPTISLYIYFFTNLRNTLIWPLFFIIIELLPSQFSHLQSLIFYYNHHSKNIFNSLASFSLYHFFLSYFASLPLCPSLG